MSETPDAPESAPPPFPESSRRCLNCSQPLFGKFCHHCGQQDRPVKRFFPSLLLEGLEGLFAFESRTYRSIWCLFTRPGFLSREYLEGRRASYLPPVRLFVVFGLLLLFSISAQFFLESLGIDVDQSDVEFFSGQTGESADTQTTATPADQDSVPPGNTAANVESGLGREMDEEEFLDGILAAIEQFRLPFLSEQNNARFVTELGSRAERNVPAIMDDPGSFLDQMLESAPLLMFVMMPVLALILKIFYLTSNRYYIEHLVLTVHNQSFLFFSLILVFLLDVIALAGLPLIVSATGFLGTILNLWIVIYLYQSLRRFFGQGWFVTGFKFVIITLIYGALYLTGILLLMLVGVFLY